MTSYPCLTDGHQLVLADRTKLAALDRDASTIDGLHATPYHSWEDHGREM